MELVHKMCREILFLSISSAGILSVAKDDLDEVDMTKLDLNQKIEERDETFGNNVRWLSSDASNMEDVNKDAEGAAPSVSQEADEKNHS